MLSSLVNNDMTQAQLIEPASLQAYQEPFPYFTAAASFSHESMSSLLAWLESDARWKLVEADFYEQHELCLTQGQLPGPVSFLRRAGFLDAMRREVGGIFNQSFAVRVDWSVHKMLAGQRIRIHNDVHTNGETHRVIIHINRGWSMSKGGFLMLFDSANPVDIHRVLMPLSGSVIGFEISEKSSHAVSKVLDGERFSVVYSLYAHNRY